MSADFTARLFASSAASRSLTSLRTAALFTSRVKAWTRGTASRANSLRLTHFPIRFSGCEGTNRQQETHDENRNCRCRKAGEASGEGRSREAGENRIEAEE